MADTQSFDSTGLTLVAEKSLGAFKLRAFHEPQKKRTAG